MAREVMDAVHRIAAANLRRGFIEKMQAGSFPNLA
jgi:hypothetical protein